MLWNFFLLLLLTFSDSKWDGCLERRRECTVWRSAPVFLSHNYLAFLATLMYQVSSIESVPSLLRSRGSSVESVRVNNQTFTGLHHLCPLGKEFGIFFKRCHFGCFNLGGPTCLGFFAVSTHITV